MGGGGSGEAGVGIVFGGAGAARPPLSPASP